MPWGWAAGLGLVGKNLLKAEKDGPGVHGHILRVLSVSLFPQDNTEILGYLLGGIATLGAWASRIPPLSRIVSLGPGLWVTLAGLRASGSILPAPGHRGGEVVSPFTCARVGVYVGVCACIHMCVGSEQPPPGLGGS